MQGSIRQKYTERNLAILPREGLNTVMPSTLVFFWVSLARKGNKRKQGHTEANLAPPPIQGTTQTLVWQHSCHELLLVCSPNPTDCTETVTRLKPTQRTKLRSWHPLCQSVDSLEPVQALYGQPWQLWFHKSRGVHHESIMSRRHFHSIVLIPEPWLLEPLQPSSMAVTESWGEVFCRVKQSTVTSSSYFDQLLTLLTAILYPQKRPWWGMRAALI